MPNRGAEEERKERREQKGARGGKRKER